MLNTPKLSIRLVKFSKAARWIALSVIVAGLAGILAGMANAASGCSAQASRSWPANAQQHVIVEAISVGPDCAKAAILLTVRGPTGELLWTDVNNAEILMYIDGLEEMNVKVMTSSLKKWIAEDGRKQHTDALPDWPQGADGLSLVQQSSDDVESEPFASEINRDFYLKLRKAKLPLLCYQVGFETLTCIALTAEGKIQMIGSQSFH